MKRILIVHGWFQSTNRYRQLKHDLEQLGHEVILFELFGFGGVASRKAGSIVNSYKRSLLNFLILNNIDLVVGHDAGAAVVLRVVVDYQLDIDIALISPWYGELSGYRLISRYPALLEKIISLLQDDGGLSALLDKIVINNVSKFVYSDNKVDDFLFEDFNRADARVASLWLSEMVHNKWKVKKQPIGKVFILISQQDEIIDLEDIDALCQKCNAFCYELRNVGDCIIIDDYDGVLQFLETVVNDI